MKILFFIGSLYTGGKERRLIELLSYLKKKNRYEILLVTTKNNVVYPKFLTLGIPWVVMEKNSYLSKISFFLKIYNLVKDFQPNIIHTWGMVQTLYTLPTVLITNTKLVNSQITSAPPKVDLVHFITNRLNFYFSDSILSNSIAGVAVFNPPAHKTKIIYNGIDLNRFRNLPEVIHVKKKYQIKTKFLILMVANFSKNKDYEKFFRLGKLLTENRNDLTCMGVGYFEEDSLLIKNCRQIIGNNPFLRIQSEISEVEALVNASDIGILFSPNGEGISNSILEYMALSKPVIANDAGGTKEVVLDNQTGYLIKSKHLAQIASKITELLDNDKLRAQMGTAGRNFIEKKFTVDEMGSNFEAVYMDLFPIHKVESKYLNS